MDCLTIILIFLIFNINMETQKTTVPENMKLPSTYVNDKVALDNLLKNGQTLVLKMYPNEFFYGVENIRIGSADDFMNNDEVRESLYRLMARDAKQITDKGQEPAVLLMGDSKLTCAYVSEIMATIADANFSGVFFTTINYTDPNARLQQQK